jgi:hypothetical protein
MTAIEKFETGLNGSCSSDDKTIILWGQEDLLVTTVQRLLLTKKSWKVIRISDQMDEETMAREMENVNPQILIIHVDIIFRHPHLLIKFVQAYSKLKIITVSLESNVMEIYNKQTVCIKEASDLLTIIEADTTLTSQGGETKPLTITINQSTPVHGTGKLLQKL